MLARLAGPLTELRAARLAAKTARRKGERAKRLLLGYALRRALGGGGGAKKGGGDAGGGGASGGGAGCGGGLFLEFGVASGGSINFLAERVPDGTRLHGFDSFEGLPERWREGRGGGFFDRGGSLPPVAPNVSLHVGWFDATLPAFLRSEAAAAAAEAAAAAAAAAAAVATARVVGAASASAASMGRVATR